MRYIDTNVFIRALSGDPAAVRVLHGIVDKSVEGATSCLTWDEFVWVLRKHHKPEVVADEGRKFISFPHLFFIDVTSATIQKAQEFMERYSLRPRDAIHAAAAIENGIREIISDDNDFDKIKELKRIPLEK